MPDLYNLTWMNETKSPLDIVTGISSSISNEYLIGNLILLSFFLIMFILSFRHDFKEMLMINSFITTILAILFAYAGIIAHTTIIVPAVILFLSLIFNFFS